ncbi:MAG: 50S ribosomal protein L25, partial [Alphaproteobacteria bacterium]
MSKSNKALVCNTRERSGKGAARALRREGKVPAIIYSKGSEPVAVAVGKNDLQLEYQRGRFHSRIVELTLDGKTIKTLPQDMQFHPVSDQI